MKRLFCAFFLAVLLLSFSLCAQALDYTAIQFGDTISIPNVGRVTLNKVHIGEPIKSYIVAVNKSVPYAFQNPTYAYTDSMYIWFEGEFMNTSRSPFQFNNLFNATLTFSLDGNDYHYQIYSEPGANSFKAIGPREKNGDILVYELNEGSFLANYPAVGSLEKGAFAFAFEVPELVYSMAEGSLKLRLTSGPFKMEDNYVIYIR